MFSRPDGGPVTCQRIWILSSDRNSAFQTEKSENWLGYFQIFYAFTHGGYDNEPFPTSLHPSARQTCPSPYSPPQYLCPPSRVPASRVIAASSAAPPRKEVSSDADLSAPIDSPSKSCHFLQLPLFAIPVRDAPSRSPGIGIRPRVWTARRSRSSSDHTIRTFRASPLEYHP